MYLVQPSAQSQCMGSLRSNMVFQSFIHPCLEVLQGWRGLGSLFHCSAVLGMKDSLLIYIQSERHPFQSMPFASWFLSMCYCQEEPYSLFGNLPVHIGSFIQAFCIIFFSFLICACTTTTLS